MEPQDVKRESKELRSRHNQAVRAKAPIAANFEDCLQSFGRLCASIHANAKDGDEYVVAENCYSRLRSWGIDSGASTRDLDHRLRRSSQLSAVVLELLVDLNSILEEANEAVTPSSDSVEFPFDLDGSVSSSTEEIRIFEDRLPELNVEQHLEDVMDIVSCLANLLPNLQDPTPQDTYERNISNEDSRTDVKLALLMFPKAPRSLNERLGKANWRRRQNLMHSKKLGSNHDVKASYRETEAEFARYVAHFAAELNDSPGTRLKSFNSPLCYPRYARRGTSDAGGSTSASLAETVFSKPSFRDGFSVTTIEEPEELHQVLFRPPRLPVPLKSGTSFTCPYCRLELVIGDQIKSKEDWNHHVYLDLEPYLCTFDECIRADRAFGVRGDWFHHELYCHRIKKVWFCRKPSCKEEFATKDLFEKHLESVHPNLLASVQMPLLIENCVGYSQLPLPEQTCLLCGTKCRDNQTLEKHLGIHLEQLALTAIAWAEMGTDRDGSDKEEDPDEEKMGASLLLDEYVQEQFGYHLPKLKKESPAATQPHQSKEIGITLHKEQAHSGVSVELSSNDMSEVANFSDDEKPKKMKDGLWEHKVEAFLIKQGVEEEEEAEDLPDVLPSIRSNTPPKIANFVGRVSDLERLQSYLSSAGQICVLSGPGGVGKTSTAIEYSYQYETQHDFVFWIEAETPGGCANTYSLIASELNLGGGFVHDQDGLTILVREFLQNTKKRWLLIFDNVEAWSDIVRYIPGNLSKTNGSVLITTREHELIQLRTARKYHHIKIEALGLEESRQLLLCSMQPNLSQKDLRSHPDYELAAEASSLVEGLPLAISMIAGYVKVSRCDLSEFLDIWNERQLRSKRTKRSTNAKGPQSTSDLAIDILWDIGIRELPAPERKLLDILVFLDAEFIQHELLVDDHKEPFLEFLNSSETTRYKRMIAQLSGRRLVAVKEQHGRQTLSIHRLLQEKIFNDLDAEKFSEVFDKAYCLVRKKYPPASPIQVPEPQKWPACKEYTPHVLSLHRAFKRTANIKPSLGLAQLFYDAGFHIWERQITPQEGVLFLETSEEILNYLDIDSNAKLRADIHCMLALLYDNFGLSKEVESLERRKKALAIRQRVFSHDPSDARGESNVLLANAAHDLGYRLLETNAFEEAEKLFETCYKRYCEWGAEDEIPFEYWKYYSSTGRVRMLQGNYPEAIQFLRKAVILIDKELGKTWRYWASQFSLACGLLQSGDLQSALELHLETFSARQLLCGKHDASTISSKYAVGSMYRHLGNMPAAIDHFKECIQMAENSNWPDEALGRTKFNLAATYRQQGIQSEEARRLEEEASEILEKYSSMTPAYLRDVQDKLMLFDSLQPAEGGRFTGRALLAHIQDWNRRTDEGKLD